MNKESLLSQILVESEISFARSSGAGGQNVNKVESKVVLRWDASQSSIPYEIAQKLVRFAGHFKVGEHTVLISSEKFRDREKNKKDVLQKLENLISNATKETKKRTATKPTRSSKERRLQSKRVSKEKKVWRSKVKY